MMGLTAEKAPYTGIRNQTEGTLPVLLLTPLDQLGYASDFQCKANQCFD